MSKTPRSSWRRNLDRISCSLQAVAVVALLGVATLGFMANSADVSIARLKPWWQGFAIVCLVLAATWLLHVLLMRYIPIIASLSVAAISIMIMVFGVVLFGPIGMGLWLWVPCALFGAITLALLLTPTVPRERP